MKTNVQTKVAGIAATLVILAGCDQRLVTPLPIDSVTLSPEVLSLEIGESADVVVELRSSSGDLLHGYPISWTVEQAEVLSLTEEGVVTPLALGETRVLASAGNRTGSATVQIVPSGDLVLTPLEWTFSGTAGGEVPTAFMTIESDGDVLSQLAVSVSDVGGQTDWLDVVMSSTTTPADLSLVPDVQGLAPGTYESTVTISALEAYQTTALVRLVLDDGNGDPGDGGGDPGDGGGDPGDGGGDPGDGGGDPGDGGGDPGNGGGDPGDGGGDPGDGGGDPGDGGGDPGDGGGDPGDGGGDPGDGGGDPGDGGGDPGDGGGDPGDGGGDPGDGGGDPGDGGGDPGDGGGDPGDGGGDPGDNEIGLILDVPTVEFDVTVGDPDPATVQVQVSSDGAAVSSLSVDVFYDETGVPAWLTAVLLDDETPTGFNLSVSLDGLPVGTYGATVEVSAPGASSAQVEVALDVRAAPLLSVNLPIVPLLHVGGVALEVVPVLVTGLNLGGPVSVDAQVLFSGGQPTGWLSASLGGPELLPGVPLLLDLDVSSTGLTPGNHYEATVRLTATGAPPVDVGVNLIVVGLTNAGMEFDPYGVEWDVSVGSTTLQTADVEVSCVGGLLGGTLCVLLGLLPSPTIEYVSGPATGWLSHQGGGLLLPAMISLTADPTGLPVGEYVAKVKVAGLAGLVTSSREFSVVLRIAP